MNPRKYRLKGKRDKLQQQIFDSNHKKIREALKSPRAAEGLSRSEIKKITHIRSDRILRKHLRIFRRDGQITERKRKVFWLTQYQRYAVWERLTEEFVSILERSAIRPRDFFENNVIWLIPEKNGKRLKYNLVFSPIVALNEGHAQEFWNGYVKYGKKLTFLN